MANYQGIGNVPIEEVFGSKENAEKVLRAMNHCKTIGVLLGAEHNPPYVWNVNIPEPWITIIGDAVMDKVMKSKTWKPDDAFISGLRQKCKEAL